MKILNLGVITGCATVSYDLPVQFDCNQIYERVQMYTKNSYDSTWTRLTINAEFNENGFTLHRAMIFGNFYTLEDEDNHGLNLSDDVNLVFYVPKNKAGAHNSVILCLVSDAEILAIKLFSKIGASDSIKLSYD